MHWGRALLSAAEHSPCTEQAGKSPGPKTFVVEQERRQEGKYKEKGSRNQITPSD